MEITWLGHSCFSIKGKKVAIITDPYDNSIGYALGNPKADIVTVSHQHRGHNCAAAVAGTPRILRGPGEYEISGVMIKGVSTFHDTAKGEQREKNTAYLINIEDVRICHLGDLGHTMSAERAAELAEADVLMIPVGGVSTIDAAGAAEMVRLLEPKIVIPMHFKTEALNFQLDPIENFLKEIGIQADLRPEPKIVISKANLPQSMQVVVMNYRLAV